MATRTCVDLILADDAPVGLPSYPQFISNPTYIRTVITKNHGIGLVLPNDGNHRVPLIVTSVVNFPVFIGSPIIPRTSIGSVKPDLKNISVIGHQLFELFVKDVYIGFPPILGMIPAPGGSVHPDFQS